MSGVYMAEVTVTEVLFRANGERVPDSVDHELVATLWGETLENVKEQAEALLERINTQKLQIFKTDKNWTSHAWEAPSREGDDEDTKRMRNFHVGFYLAVHISPTTGLEEDCQDGPRIFPVAGYIQALLELANGYAMTRGTVNPLAIAKGRAQADAAMAKIQELEAAVKAENQSQDRWNTPA